MGKNQKLVAEAVIFSFSTMLPLDFLRRSLKLVITGKTVEVCSLFSSANAQKVRVSMGGGAAIFLNRNFLLSNQILNPLPDDKILDRFKLKTNYRRHLKVHLNGK